MTVYLHLYSTNFVSQFLLWSSIRTCLQSSHYEDNHYIFLCCECQSLSMPNRACPKVQSFLVFGLFFYWFLNYTRGPAFRREISNIHIVCQNRIHVCQSAFTWHTFRYGFKPVQDLHPGSVSIWASNLEGAVCKVSLGPTRCNLHQIPQELPWYTKTLQQCYCPPSVWDNPFLNLHEEQNSWKYFSTQLQRFPVPIFSIPIPVPRLSSPGARFRFRFWDCPSLGFDSDSGSETKHA